MTTTESQNELDLRAVNDASIVDIMTNAPAESIAVDNEGDVWIKQPNGRWGWMREGGLDDCDPIAGFQIITDYGVQSVRYSVLPVPDLFDGVLQFMTASKQPIPDKPQIPLAPVAALRLDMLLEEVAEVCVAAGFTGLFDAALAWDNDKDLAAKGQPKTRLVGRIRDHIAQGRYDLVETVDGYEDVKYVAQGGTLENAGAQGARAAQDEVVRNNMTKILPDGTVLKSDAGKILKPDTHVPADVRGALIRHGAEL